MSTILKNVSLLENKLEYLLERYNFLKEENDILLANIYKLQVITSKCENNLSKEIEKYRVLKIAKTIKGSKDDSEETKRKINALIQEIDKCVVKLSL